MAGGIQQTLLFSGTADEDVIACGYLVFGEDTRISSVALTQSEMITRDEHKFENVKILKS